MAIVTASTYNTVYSDKSIFGEMETTAKMVPKNPAVTFYGKTLTYEQLITEIEAVARSLKTLGIGKGDIVTIMLPNCTQAVIMVYAINMIGAVANMVHPLSSERDVEISLKITGSKYAITLDTFAQIYINIQPRVALKTLIVTYVQEGMGTIQGLLYPFVSHTKKIKFDQDFILLWKKFLKGGKSFIGQIRVDVKPEDPAIIIHTGGTTGTPKGALHCNLAFNALARQMGMTCGINTDDSVLAIIPVFHGFGLGVSIFAALAAGGHVFLLPRYFAEEYAKLTLKHKITYHIGTPSLFESQTRTKTLQNADLSFIRGMFSGGDFLTDETKKNITKFVQDRGCKIYPRQGYGLAECIGAVSLEPTVPNKVCSIGTILPGLEAKIVKPDTTEELPLGELGEICLCGPNMMLGYLDNPEETAKVIRTHEDGKVWVHTGDLGRIDADGDLYYTQRIKRMIVTNGYNVYPSQIEEVFDTHKMVRQCCVIGVPDEFKGQRVVIYVVPSEAVTDKEAAKATLIQFGRDNVAKFAKPSEVVFRDSLPLTMLNKVDYRALEREYVESYKKQ